ncbi:MAG: DNA primase [Treponema sp.]|nr:DNA primase [Treponema sp.]
MPYISETSIQEVKDRTDAIAVASDYVKLEKRGGRWWACCPFHQEKTGSFTVSSELKTYYCFGCHKGGTIINFVMEMDKLSYPEAISLLAARFGIQLVYEKSSGDPGAQAADEAKKQRKDDLFELYRRMAGTFHHFLMETDDGRAAKQYIMARGINIETIEQFRLGYAPQDRYWLHKFLLHKGYSAEFLATSGLFSSRFPGVGLFSGRLLFSIADKQGKIVAFGGRYLPPPDEHLAAAPSAAPPPKYINSPETEIYKKGQTLFAIDLAIPEIRRTKMVYIAEGYMDVLALHQAGISNAVAPLGTAFTDEQAKLLQRWAENAVFFFDDDEAGQVAAVKGILTCRKNNLPCAVVAAPNAAASTSEVAENTAAVKDPADILQNFGTEALQKNAKCFIINDFDFLIRRAKAIYDAKPTSVQGKAQAVAFAFPYVALLDSEVAKNSCIEAIADSFGLLVSAVGDDFRRYAAQQSSPRRGISASHSVKEETNPRVSAGRTDSRIRMNDELALLIATAVSHVSPGEEKLFPKFRAALEINEVEDQYAKEIYIALEECIRYGESDMDELLARIFSPELRGLFVEKSASGEFSINSRQLVADGIKKIKGRLLERRQEEILIQLRTQAGTDEVRELLAEKMQIDNDLSVLRQAK